MDDDFQLLREYVAAASGASGAASEAAFGRLVARHIDMVYSACLRLLRNPHDAEDATQAVFIALARKARGIGPGTVLAGWLYRTATFVSISAARRARARRKYEMDAAAAAERDANGARDRRAADIDAARFDVDWALGKLRADERHAVLLRFFENRSFLEVARELHLTEEAARKRVSRAVDRLRDLLGAKAAGGATRAAPALSAAVVEQILSHASHHAPAALAASATHAAAGAAGAGSAAAASTSLAKGAMALMALSNAKLAAGAVVAVLLVGGGAAAITWKASHHAAPQQVVLDSGVHRVGQPARNATDPTLTSEQRIEMSNRVKSASNLRQIGLAALTYALDGKSGKLPSDLNLMFTSQELSPDVFLNPRLGSKLPPELKSASRAQQAQWVKEHSDYLWFGTGLTNRADANVIIAAEKPDGLSGGLNMLYADGHVEFWAMPNAQPLLEQARQAMASRAASRAQPVAETRAK